MKYQDLINHVTQNACVVDHFNGDAYYVTNVLNGHIYIIEELKEYSVPTLCHYFYELGIPSPAHLKRASR